MRRGMSGVANVDARPGGRMASAWWTVAALMLLYVVSYLDRTIVTLLVEDIKRDLSLNDLEISIFMGPAYAVSYAIFGLGFGWAADRFSRRWVIFTGLTIWSFAASACGLAQNLIHLILARLGVGAGESALSPAGYAMISDSFPKERLTFAMSVFVMGSVIGSALSMGIGGLLIAIIPEHGLVVGNWGPIAAWRVVLLVTGVPCLLVSWIVFTLREKPRGPATATVPLPAGAVWRQMRGNARFYGGHFIGFSLNSLCGSALVAWIPAYMSRRYGWNAADIGLTLALVMSVATVSGLLLSGAAVDWWFRRGRRDAHLIVFAITGLSQAALVAVAMTVADPTTFLLLITLIFMPTMFSGAAASSLQIMTPPELRGTISSVYIMIFSLIGVGGGPAVAAGLTAILFADQMMIGWGIAVTFAIFMPLSGLCLLAAARPMRERLAGA